MDSAASDAITLDKSDLSALSSDVRIGILRAIDSSEGGTISAAALADEMSIGKSTLHQHLAVLETGVLAVELSGHMVYGGLSGNRTRIFGLTSRYNSRYTNRPYWCSEQVLSLRPLVCKTSALPLSYQSMVSRERLELSLSV